MSHKATPPPPPPLMRIGGYVPCSLSDFPGRIAAVVFTQGCNWRCPWCHNTALVYPEQFTTPIPEADILQKLATRRGKLDGVVISGGEPTLHPDLPDFIRRVRALGFLIKLDTNGSRPAVVRALIAEGLLDFVATDIKAPWPRYAEAAGLPSPTFDTAALQETLALLRESGIEHQLRTTRWPGLTEADAPDIETIAAGSPHVWQEYRPVSP
ncbi:anaerobic ribonucleoside-triphosphate reductase activating protein [Geminisphaera colitermitum]|uniref:anaerobic ribonucleoside-triphosphate reductase activating protein n=1 Tax=Geminisphaera colitermitum TaxID=1148786 RepID=UPI001E376449|nr:anaerobic ribonucleoside-triphosphate reductase activating protein [Geminisphaera colitermitum]